MVTWLSANSTPNTWDHYYTQKLRDYFDVELVNFHTNLLIQYISLLLGSYRSFYIANFATTNGFLCAITLKRYHLIIYGSDLLLSYSWHRYLRLYIACFFAKSISLSTETEGLSSHKYLRKFSSKRIPFPFIRNAIKEVDLSWKSICNEKDLLSIRNCSPHYRIIEIINFWDENLRNTYPRLVVITAKKNDQYFKEICDLIKQKKLTNKVYIIDKLLPREKFLSEIKNAGACISLARTDFLGGPIVDALQLETKLYINYSDVYNEFISNTDAVTCTDGQFSENKIPLPDPDTSINHFISMLNANR